MNEINDKNDYLTVRVDAQIKYFDTSAITNQSKYKKLKKLAIFCNIFTTMLIALAFTLPDPFKLIASIGALILSMIVLGTYQIEEFQNFGAKWEKFRLVAESLKSEKQYYLNRAGKYLYEEKKNKKLLVETVEGIIRGTDLSYFTLMVEPGKRIEKRLEVFKKEGD